MIAQLLLRIRNAIQNRRKGATELTWEPDAVTFVERPPRRAEFIINFDDCIVTEPHPRRPIECCATCALLDTCGKSWPTATSRQLSSLVPTATEDNPNVATCDEWKERTQCRLNP